MGVLLTAQVERLYSSSAEAGFRAEAPVGVGVTQLQVRQQEMVVGSARRRSHQTLCAKLPQLAKQPVARALSLSLRVCLRSRRSKTVTVIWSSAACLLRGVGPLGGTAGRDRGGAEQLGRAGWIGLRVWQGCRCCCCRWWWWWGEFISQVLLLWSWIYSYRIVCVVHSKYNNSAQRPSLHYNKLYLLQHNIEMWI